MQRGERQLLREINRRPCRGGIIDLDTGTYRGVRFGSTLDEVTERFGRGVSQGPATTLSNPQGNDGAPPVLGFGGTSRAPRGLRRYRNVVVFFAGRRVHTLLVDDPRAATAGGVAIGDPLDRVKEVYEDALCGTVDENTEYEPYPACYLKRKGHYIWFGPDPIRSITLSIPRIDFLTPE